MNINKNKGNDFNNDDFENFLNANSVSNNNNGNYENINIDKNNSLCIEDCEMSRSLNNINKVGNINKFENVLPGQKLNNLNNILVKKKTGNLLEDEIFDIDNQSSLSLENLEREKDPKNIEANKPQNIFKKNLHDSSKKIENIKDIFFEINTNNEPYNSENRFSNVKFENELKSNISNQIYNSEKNQLNLINKNQPKIDLKDIYNKENEIEEEFPHIDNSIIFKNNLNLDSKKIGINNDYILSNSNTYANTFAKISVNDKILNETEMGNLKIHDFKGSQFSQLEKNNNIKNTNDSTITNPNTKSNNFSAKLENLNTTENMITDNQTHLHTDFSNNFNKCNSLQDKNIDELKSSNLIIFNASDFNNRKDNIKNESKDQEIYNKRNFKKFISKNTKINKNRDNNYETNKNKIDFISNIPSDNNSNNSNNLDNSSNLKGKIFFYK